ncbi:MAG: pyridoxal phosphate-dependent aminotransferase, partial [Candidatus Dadabacteria bacterium]|nr:pyridoxal phosphate-dependent aminotransferase [Candidatus Dadabacteria bacterium]
FKKEGVASIKNGFTKYTAVGGIDELKDAIAAGLKKDHGLEYSRDEILVSCGAKHSIYNITQALFEAGNEVLIPAPYWVSYPDQVALTGATPVIMDTDERRDFKITPQQLQAEINERTRALILNYPSNPTGTTYSFQELEEIVGVAIDAGLIIISDEIYEKIIYADTEHVSVCSLGKRAKESTILVNGVSKSYSMTGWRIGYAAGDKSVIAAMAKLQGQSTSNPSSISQMAALEALRGAQELLGKRAREFERRKNFIVKRLNEIPGFTCFDPKGAFYVFPSISSFVGKTYRDKKIDGSISFTEFLLEEAKVAVVPGIAFGKENHLRISYATSMENIEAGLNRIEKAVKILL